MAQRHISNGSQNICAGLSIHAVYQIATISSQNPSSMNRLATSERAPKTVLQALKAVPNRRS